MLADPLLGDACRRLERARVPYMITGSVASTFHGEPRSTRDVDIVIDPDASGLERLLDDLVAGGYYVDRDTARAAVRERTQFNAIGDRAAKVDFIVRKDRPFSIEEFGRRQATELVGTTVFVATAEDVVLAKLEWVAATGSERQLGDVVGVLASGGDALDRAYIERWVAALGVDEAWGRALAELSSSHA